MRIDAVNAASAKPSRAPCPSRIARLVPARIGASEMVKDHGRSARHHASALPGARCAASAVMGGLSMPRRFDSHKTLVQYLAARVCCLVAEMEGSMKQIMVLATAAALALPIGAQAQDAKAGEAAAKKAGCLKCHAVSADKDGPSF